MTQWIASLLKGNMLQQSIASVVSDGMFLHIQKVSHSWTSPQYILMLDLRSAKTNQLVRVADIRGETPQVCAALLGQIVSITNQTNIGNAVASSAT